MNSLVLTFKEGEPPSAGYYLVRLESQVIPFDVDYWNCEARNWAMWSGYEVVSWAELPIA